MLFVLTLLAAAWAQSATDTDRARAADLFDNASSLYEEGAYDSAIVVFQESLELSGEPARAPLQHRQLPRAPGAPRRGA